MNIRLVNRYVRVEEVICMHYPPIHDALYWVLSVEREREEIVELLPVVQSLDIVDGQVPFHLWTGETQLSQFRLS